MLVMLVMLVMLALMQLALALALLTPILGLAQGLVLAQT